MLLAAVFAGGSGVLVAWMGRVLQSADAVRPALSINVFGWEAVRRLARHPEELGLEPLCPDAAEGSVFTYQLVAG